MKQGPSGGPSRDTLLTKNILILGIFRYYVPYSIEISLCPFEKEDTSCGCMPRGGSGFQCEDGLVIIRFDQLQNIENSINKTCVVLCM